MKEVTGDFHIYRSFFFIIHFHFQIIIPERASFFFSSKTKQNQTYILKKRLCEQIREARYIFRQCPIVFFSSSIYILIPFFLPLQRSVLISRVDNPVVSDFSTHPRT